MLKESINFLDREVLSGTSSSPYEPETVGPGKWKSFKDSFKPVEVPESSLKRRFQDDEELTEIQRINIQTASSPLKRKLKNRHLQMIAIASSIGSGLLIGTGSALHTGGPAGILIAWSLTGSAILCTIQAMAELAVTFPISGSFNVYASKFIDPSVGFAVAWNYFFQFLVLLPLELVAGSMTMQYWNTSINPDVWVLIFYITVISINFFGVRAYGEAEFVFSTLKVIAVVGFIILSIVLAANGGPVKKPTRCRILA
jgi:amino acid transporter